MKKVTIEFDFEDGQDREDLKELLNYKDYKRALEHIAERVLRKYRKYGFSDHQTDLLKSHEDVVDFIEKEFYEVLKDYEIELF